MQATTHPLVTSTAHAQALSGVNLVTGEILGFGGLGASPGVPLAVPAAPPGGPLPLQKLAAWRLKDRGVSHETKLHHLSSGHISPKSATVTIARNATYCRLHIPGDGRQLGGGLRSSIQEFSFKSRRKLLRLVNSIDQVSVGAGAFDFVTCTYPNDFPTGRASKKHLDILLKRFEREWGRRAVIWKIEPQTRGAPHFHMLVMHGSCEDMYQARLEWWARTWCEIVGSDDKNHLRLHLGQFGNRPCVEVCRDWKGVIVYAGKYMAKPTGQGGEAWDQPGRFWGVRRKKLLNITEDVEELQPAEAIQLRRVMRRWYEKQPTGFIYLIGVGGLPGTRIHKRQLQPGYLAALKPSNFRMQTRRVIKSAGGMSLFLPDNATRRAVTWAREIVLFEAGKLVDMGMKPYEAVRSGKACKNHNHFGGRNPEADRPSGQARQTAPVAGVGGFG